jgi:hypothetical protein
MRRMHSIDFSVISQTKETDYSIGLCKYIYIHAIVSVV